MTEHDGTSKNNDFTKRPHIWNATHIHNENLTLATQEKDCPVLLVCIRKDDKAPEYIHMLQATAQRFEGAIKVYFAFDELIPYLSRTYGLHGTPTFLLLRNGNVLDSLLGTIDYDDLSKILRDTFFSPDTNMHTGESA